MLEDAVPRPGGRGALIRDLAREDLDPYAVEELRERIDALEAELARTHAALDRKAARRSAADALFTFKAS